MSVPIGYDEIIEYYGNPDLNGDMIPDPEFAKNFLVKEPLPFPLLLPWNNAKCFNIYGHKYAVKRIQRFFLYVASAYGGYEMLHEQGLDVWGGCYQFRAKRGGDKLSTHAWGIAFDYLPHLGPFGRRSRIPNRIVAIAEDLGFVNGGGWEVPDGMHFQLCKGY